MTICRPVAEHPLQRNYGVSDLIEALGKRNGVVEAESEAPVVVLERTRTADATPVVRTVDHLDVRIVESASALLPPHVSFQRWLHDHCGIPSRTRLRIDQDEPVFVLVDFSVDGRPVLHPEEYEVAHAFDVTAVRDGLFGG